MVRFVVFLALTVLALWFQTDGFTVTDMTPALLMEIVAVTLCLGVCATWPAILVKALVWVLRVPLLMIFAVGVITSRTSDRLDVWLVRLRDTLIGKAR